MASNSLVKASTATLGSPSEPTNPIPASELRPSKATTPSVAPSMDEILTLLGVGPGTFYYFFAVAFFGVTTLFGALSTQFVAPELDFNCSQPHGWPAQGSQCELPILLTNSTIHNGSRSPMDSTYSALDSSNPMLAYQDSLTKSSSVDQPQNTHNSSAAVMLSCERFSYQDDVFQSTLTSDLNLVCSRAWLRPLFQLTFTAGCSVGAVLCAVVSSRFGRQTVVWWSSLLTSFLILIVATVPDIIAVTIARFFMGVLSPFIVCISFTLGLEVCPIKHRTVYSSMVAVPYSVTLLLLTAVAYGSREWKVVQLMGLIGPLAQSIFLSPCFLVESPLWLVTEGRLKEAEANIRNIARRNKRSYYLPEDLADILKINYERQLELEASLHTAGTGSPLLSLVSTAAMRRISFTTMTSSFALGVLYMVIPLRSGEFKSPFLYATFMAIFEIPAYSGYGYIVKWLGRRRASLGCCVTLAAIECILMTMEVVKSDYEVAELVLSGVAYFLLISHYQANFSQCSSLFPTQVRALGSSVAYFLSMLGWNVPALIDLVMPENPSWVPLLVNTCLAAFCGVLVLLMPDTTDAPLYQTVKEYVQAVAEQRQEARRASSSCGGKGNSSPTSIIYLTDATKYNSLSN